jgi:DNA processing protein
VPQTSDDYPAALLRIADPPPFLWVRGSLASLRLPAIAIVGARASTRYGERSAARLAADFARAGVCVVSGLARGIDATAHRAALAAGGATIAVQGCGPDRVFPASHAALADEIVAQGAVLSEFAPGTEPRKPHFPQRNRLISGLAQAVVVVEARIRSGSLSTARHALDQGLDVFAVPGPIDSPVSEGTNALLWDGAWPALDAQRVLERIGVGAATPVEAGAAPRAGDREAAEARGGALAARILAQLARGPLDPDELARALAVAPEALALPLLELELAGRVLQELDGKYRRLA